MDTESVRQHFRTQVSDYAGLMTRLIPFYDEQRDMIVRFVPFTRTDPLEVLDLGCGSGLLAARILAEYGHAHLTAFDLTQEMLDSCRLRLTGHDRVTYRLGDFRTDELGSQYDLIVASLSLHHLQLSERPGFLHRAYDSLKGGGVLIASEVIVDESPSVREYQDQLWREFMTENGEDGMAWYRKHLEKDHPVPISLLLSMLGGSQACCFWQLVADDGVCGRTAGQHGHERDALWQRKND